MTLLTGATHGGDARRSAITSGSLSRITRRVKCEGENGLLSTAERTELKGKCAAFGAAWRGSYHRILAPKGHIVEARVPWFVDRNGICGVFSEDDAEALHVRGGR